MSPSGVSSIFLLVVLMYMPDTSNAGIAEICAEKYPVQACNIESYTWFVLDDKRCMKVTWDLLTFDEAQAHCKSKGAQLVSVNNQEQYDRLLCYMYRITRGNRRTFWIGARRGNEVFSWVGGGVVRSSRLFMDRLNNHDSAERCVQTNYLGWERWDGRFCSNEYAFVCAKNKS